MLKPQLTDPFIDPKDAVYKHMKNPIGNSINLNVNGSITPVSFRYTCPDTTNVVLVRMNIQMDDNAITYAKFGGIAALSNGVLIRICDREGKVNVDLLDGQTVKTNLNLAWLAGFDVLTDTAVLVRWTLERAGKQLLLRPGDFIELVVQDNLSSITAFSIMIQGYNYPLVV